MGLVETRLAIIPGRFQKKEKVMNILLNFADSFKVREELKD
jgi:hypothetical protein